MADSDPATRTTRRELLRRASTGAVVVLYGGALTKTAVAGAPKYRRRELKDTLKIAQWSHFVPAYDVWFDNVHAKRWGQANDTEVIVDHINQASLATIAAAEVAGQGGHDLFAFLTPPAQYEDQVVALNDVVQEIGRARGKMAIVADRSTYNPRTKKYFGFADMYAPDPIHYRTDLWNQVGIQPTTWDNVLKAAPKLRELGHPIGIGMSNEIDSNIAGISLLMCFGGFIQNEEQRVVIDSKGTRDALKFMRDLYRRGMSNEVFAWNASSNNMAYLAGQISLAFNAISIIRRAETLNAELAASTALAPVPAGPDGRRLGLEGVIQVYVLWKFSRNKEKAKKFLVDLEVKYQGAFENSKFFNFPSFPGSVPHLERRLERDPATPHGKYAVLQTINENFTYNIGYPGYSNAAINQLYDEFLIPQMFAQVAQDKLTPAEAARAAQREIGKIFEFWRKRKKV